MTRRQDELMRELTLWYALLTAVQADPKLRRFGLCYAFRHAFGDELSMSRAHEYHPKESTLGYWWHLNEWKPRYRFIHKMIQLVEQELAS